MTIGELMRKAGDMAYEKGAVMVQVGDKVYEAASARFEVNIMNDQDYGRLVLAASVPTPAENKVYRGASNSED